MASKREYWCFIGERPVLKTTTMREKKVYSLYKGAIWPCEGMKEKNVSSYLETRAPGGHGAARKKKRETQEKKMMVMEADPVVKITAKALQ